MEHGGQATRLLEQDVDAASGAAACFGKNVYHEEIMGVIFCFVKHRFSGSKKIQGMTNLFIFLMQARLVDLLHLLLSRNRSRRFQ